MLSPNFGKQIHVLVLDKIPQIALDIFEKASWEVDTCLDELSESELAKKVPEYNVICLNNNRPDYLSEEILRSAHRLLAVGHFSRHCTSVDLSAAQLMGIPVFNAPFQHQHSVAEMIMSFVVLLSRQIGDRSREIHNGNWQKISQGCHEVRGKTIGIIGYGHVGQQVGVMSEALGLRVIFYDPVSIMPIGRSEPQDSMQMLLEQSDFISINVTNDPSNRNMIGKTEIQLMKSTAHLINASYGDAIDLNALANALKSGTLAGAALDVFPSDMVSIPGFLSECPNLILTPDIGGLTAEAETRVGLEVANSLIHYIADGTTFGAINFPSIPTWPLKPNHRRILNMHRNVRGVLKEIDYILSSYNVAKQVLDTNGAIGYLIADVEGAVVSTEIVSQLALLANTIRTRIL